jgi:hypothetical protein
MDPLNQYEYGSNIMKVWATEFHITFKSKQKHVLIIGNKMPTRSNRWFLYCRTYCLLNMFRSPLCPSSGAQEYYTVVAVCGIWYFGFQVVGLV